MPSWAYTNDNVTNVTKNNIENLLRLFILMLVILFYQIYNKILNTKDTKDMHKGHKALNKIYLSFVGAIPIIIDIIQNHGVAQSCTEENTEFLNGKRSQIEV